MPRKFSPGSIVDVGPAYRGNGHFAPDGCEGRYTVKRELPKSMGGPVDYYLVKGVHTLDALEDLPWDLIGNASRLTEVKNAA